MNLLQLNSYTWLPHSTKGWFTLEVGVVGLSNGLKSWDILAIWLNRGLNRGLNWRLNSRLNRGLLFCPCGLLLSDPCLCQGSPIHLTWGIFRKTPQQHYKHAWTGDRGVKMPRVYALIWRKTDLAMHMNHLLTWILLMLERLHPLLLAQRPLWPRLSSLVPHLSLLRITILKI